jgi:hypothetical protein
LNPTFRKLKDLYRDIIPSFGEDGFKPPSADVVTRELSGKIEASIVLHCGTFKMRGAPCHSSPRFNAKSTGGKSEIRSGSPSIS